MGEEEEQREGEGEEGDLDQLARVAAAHVTGDGVEIPGAGPPSWLSRCSHVSTYFFSRC